ncbi:MAG: IS21 family transposase [Pyrinomonadaceae bacterium]|nr:IS21 family transposase [Pyrinomonadaceae bacterium]
MPARRHSMRLVSEVLRLKHAAKLSHRQIARVLQIGIGTVTNYLAAAERAGLSWPLPAELDEAALATKLWPPATAGEAKFVTPDFVYIHEQLKQKGVTRQLLWDEYCQQHPGQAYQYTKFCTLYGEWRRRLKATMRQTHRAGEKLFVDYCGPTVAVVNVVTGEIKEAQIFVAVLGASNYTYAEATWTQGLADWIGSHTRAFSFFEGVPALIIPDNTRSAVSKACRYEPLLNTSYYQMLAHYGTAALPARPYKPRDKAKVEVAVQVVERWILARLRKQTFFSLPELNRAIHYLLTALNQRPFKKLPGCRRSQFEALDQPALRPLPAQAYEYAEWRKARVNLDYHIEVERHYYSVPHSLLRREVDVRLSEKTVEIFLAGNRVAVHLRSQRQGSHSTNAEHMPKAHRAHLEWTPGRLLNWAVQIGPHTRDLVKHLLWNKPHPEMGYRSCLGLLNLAKRFGRERLEAACQRALQLGSPNRRSVVSLLEQGLDRLPLPEPTVAQPPLFHENIRGPDYYQ